MSIPIHDLFLAAAKEHDGAQRMVVRQYFTVRPEHSTEGITVQGGLPEAEHVEQDPDQESGLKVEESAEQA